MPETQTESGPAANSNEAPSATPKILIFDSGVGGLTVFRSLLKQAPHCQYIFASDNAGFPYGTRSEYSLIQRVHRVLGQIIEKIQPDIVVIACNSASTVVLPGLRAEYSIPFVGVVPAIKPAAAISSTGHIALLATPATVARVYTHQLVRDFASGCQVTMLGSSEMVTMAERKVRGESIDMDALRDVLQPLFDLSDYRQIDTLVMACTHFPLIEEELKTLLPLVQHWIEPADAIARRVQALLDSMPNWVPSKMQHRALLTAEDAQSAALNPFLHKFGCSPIEILAVNGAD